MENRVEPLFIYLKGRLIQFKEIEKYG